MNSPIKVDGSSENWRVVSLKQKTSVGGGSTNTGPGSGIRFDFSKVQNSQYIPLVMEA